MDSVRFKEILATFTDDRDSLILEKGRLVVQIHGTLIEATTQMRDGYLIIREEGQEWPAIQWLIHRVAKLDLLADRIINNHPRNPAFVVPRGELVDQVDRAPDESPLATADAIATLGSFLDRRPAGSCSVLYLTSDAGEGKTTLISELGRRQAEAFRQRKSDWILVPIALGGRPFLRFEDVVAAALMNQLRFPHLYFDSFVELARLGIIVPALDGFEEVFVETSEGEAVSSLGTLIHQMHGEGTLLIAARRAYFEYRGLETQAKLLDGIPDVDVGFGKLRLLRWGKKEFLEYCTLRGINDPESLYQGAVARIKEDHPLLTRPVLVKRLVEIAETLEPDQLLGSLQPETDQFYRRFFDQIIEREAREKWIDIHNEPPPAAIDSF